MVLLFMDSRECSELGDVEVELRMKWKRDEGDYFLYYGEKDSNQGC